MHSGKDRQRERERVGGSGEANDVYNESGSEMLSFKCELDIS